MKVKLLARKGTHKEGEVVDYDKPSAEWLISHGYGIAVAETRKAAAATEPAPPAPRRGRPPKNASK